MLQICVRQKLLSIYKNMLISICTCNINNFFLPSAKLVLLVPFGFSMTYHYNFIGRHFEVFDVLWYFEEIPKINSFEFWGQNVFLKWPSQTTSFKISLYLWHKFVALASATSVAMLIFCVVNRKDIILSNQHDLS